MKSIKIKIESQEQCIQIQEMLFTLGFAWGNLKKDIINIDAKFLFANDAKYIGSSNNDSYFEKSKAKEVDFSWLLPIKHTIIIDDKKEEISRELYNALKEQFNN